MPIGYTYKPDQRLVLVVWDQTVTLDQFRSHIDRMTGDPDYARADAQISDLRYSTFDPSVTNTDMHDFVGSLAARRDLIAGKRLAMVAGPEWHKAKLVEDLIQPLSVHAIVFTDLTTPCIWLGLDVIEAGNALKEMRLSLRRSPS